MKEVMLSVSMITFNHEKYIEEAILNVLNQKVNFNFELVISDDCSNDNTSIIIENIIKSHPKSKLIRYVRHKKNKGMIENFLWNINNCKGKYIALCEGDDYWIDELKLQKQFNKLETNTSFNLCFTDCRTYLQEESKFIENNLALKAPSIINIYDIAKGENGFYLFTSTVMFRNIKISFPKLFYDKIGSDTSLFLLLLEKGSKGVFLEDKTSVYRVHKKGVFSSRDNETFEKRKKIELGMYEMIDAWQKYFSYDKILVKYFRRSKLSTLNKLRIISCENNDFQTIRNASIKALKYLNFKESSFKLCISMVISSLVPRLYSAYLNNV